MGAGIAQAAATAGFVVRMLDVEPGAAKAAHQIIIERLDRRVAKGELTQPDRDEIVPRLHVAEAMGDLACAEVIVEAVPEDAAIKAKVLGEMDAIASDRTLLATNTSSLSVGKLADGLSSASRFLGMHFFNPAPLMDLVEVVRGPKTDDQTYVDARAVCAKLDKTVVLVKDSPGFIGNRVNRAFYLEAMGLLEAGEADIAAIDAAMRDVGGFRMGPFQLLDHVGLDVSLTVSRRLYESMGKPARLAPNPLQQKLVEQGRLGRKSGRGFYDYEGDSPLPGLETPAADVSAWRPTEALEQFAAILDRPADRAMWLYARILLAVMNEAALVADSIAIPRDVNLTMVHGFNYPEGPLETADSVGLDVMQRLLADFFEESRGHERYVPNALLDRLSSEGPLGEASARGFLYHAL